MNNQDMWAVNCYTLEFGGSWRPESTQYFNTSWDAHSYAVRRALKCFRLCKINKLASYKIERLTPEGDKLPDLIL